VLVAPLTHVVPAACSAIKERAYKLARHTSISVSQPFFLSTYSLLLFKQIFLRCFCINHLDVYQQIMLYFYNGCLAEQSPRGTHFISNWPETLVDVNGAKCVDGADFAGAVFVSTIHLHIIRQAATPQKISNRL
jgi:hypothetical protein